MDGRTSGTRHLSNGDACPENRGECDETRARRTEDNGLNARLSITPPIQLCAIEQVLV